MKLLGKLMQRLIWAKYTQYVAILLPIWAKLPDSPVAEWLTIIVHNVDDSLRLCL